MKPETCALICVWQKHESPAQDWAELPAYMNDSGHTGSLARDWSFEWGFKLCLCVCFQQTLISWITRRCQMWRLWWMGNLSTATGSCWSQLLTGGSRCTDLHKEMLTASDTNTWIWVFQIQITAGFLRPRWEPKERDWDKWREIQYFPGNIYIS